MPQPNDPIHALRALALLVGRLAFAAFGLSSRPGAEPYRRERGECNCPGAARWDAVRANGWDVVQHPDGTWTVSDGRGDVLAADHDDPRSAVDAAREYLRARGALRLFEAEG